MNKVTCEIMDTTLRDGEQMKDVTFSPSQKELIAHELLKIGVHRIEIASAHAVEQDRDAIERICKVAKEMNRLEAVEILGFVDNEKSVNWIKSLGIRTVNFLAKGSEEHCRKQLNKTPERHFNDLKKAIAYANEQGLGVNVYLEDWSNGEKYSPGYVDDIIKMLTGLNIKRIMLPDTLGILNFWEVESFVSRRIGEFPGIHFDFHAHNDLGMSTANSIAAIKAGVHGIHVTLNRLGERAGNASLYEIVADAKLCLDMDLGIDMTQFFKLKQIIEHTSRIRLQPHEPFIGENAIIHTAGIHAHGDKMGSVYKSIAAELMGKKMSYGLGKQSGKSTIEMNLLEMGMEKVSPEIIDAVTKKIRELGGLGKVVTQEDLYLLVMSLTETKEGAGKLPFTFLEVKADVSMNGARIGYVKIHLNDEIFEETAMGDGGYDAIMNALNKCLGKKNIKLPELADYRPRIPPGGQTGAIVETFIDWKGEKGLFSTVGIDTDQTIAAIKATEKMVNLVITGYKS
ncbi:MAG: hypothetical protein JW969_15685 [Spirochaetales bacterium]|nr:hypothetical protein [Spirochaetales bacterium]